MIRVPSSEPSRHSRSATSLNSAISFQSRVIPDQVIDISNTRKLLRSTTPNSEPTDSKLTPRKRALARKASSTTNSTGFFSSPTSQQSTEDLARSPQMTTIDDNIDIDEPEEDPEAKTVLFKFKKAKILQFEDSNSSEDSKSQGRLLGSGNFEIYQLHQKRVSYLQCGKSVVYPILPRLKILKISQNQFLVSLSNPERYWRIVLETTDDTEINKLESTLRGICHFRNLYIPPTEAPSQKRSLAVITKHHSPQQRACHNNLDTKSTNSLTSISTALACFALDQSDTSTFVDEHMDALNHQESPRTLQDEEAKSDAESIDLAIDDFFETIHNDTHYYTASNTLLLEDLMSRNNSTTSVPGSPLDRNTPLHYPKQRANKVESLTGPSDSMFLSESTSWMDPSDEEPDITGPQYFSTPTPNTSLTRVKKRYISLNLNPPTVQKTVKRVITDPKLFDLHKQRQKGSVAVYNMLKNNNNDKEEADSSFTGFLKSLF